MINMVIMLAIKRSKLFLKLFNHAFDLMISLYVMVGMNLYLFSKIFIMMLLQLDCIKLVNV